MNYKAPDNSLHVIEPEFAHMLPAGCVEISDAEAAAIRAAQNQPTPQQIEADIAAEVQRRLEAWAQQREYDGIVSLCSYAGDPDPTLNAEGTLGVNTRSATWVAMKRIRAEVLAGTRPMPQTIADIEADLPTLVWPA